MTLIMLIGGVLMITYAIVNAYCPTVDKEDTEFESYETFNFKPKPIEITEVTKVERCYSPGARNDSVEENVEILVPMFTYYDVPLSDEIQQYIHIQCLEKFGTIELDGYNLPKLVINIIRWESGFNQDNDNGKCCGLMSVTHNLSDTIIEEEHITNLIEPDQNIRAGIRILKNMYDLARKSYNGKRGLIDVALDGYHCGYRITFTGFISEYTDNIKSTYETTKERS